MARQAECHPDRLHHAFGKCKPCYGASRGAADQRAWRKKNPERYLAAQYKYRYGIDVAFVNAMLIAQGGVCKICQTGSPTEIDHNHATGKVRGVLCVNCNVAVGLFKDDSSFLKRAASYVEVEGRL